MTRFPSESDRPLHSTAQSDLLGRCVLCEGLRKTLIRHPDKAIRIRRELRRIWVRSFAIENIRNRLPFVRSQSRDIYQYLIARHLPVQTKYGLTSSSLKICGATMEARARGLPDHRASRELQSIHDHVCVLGNVLTQLIPHVDR